jgi:hypothetical protein
MDSKLDPGAPAALGPPPGLPPPDDEGERPSGDDRKKSSRRSRSRSRERRRSRSLSTPVAGAEPPCPLRALACTHGRDAPARFLMSPGAHARCPPRATQRTDPRVLGGAGQRTGVAGGGTTGTGSMIPLPREEAGAGAKTTGVGSRAAPPFATVIALAPVADVPPVSALTAIASHAGDRRRAAALHRRLQARF